MGKKSSRDEVAKSRNRQEAVSHGRSYYYVSGFWHQVSLLLNSLLMLTLAFSRISYLVEKHTISIKLGVTLYYSNETNSN